MVVSDGATVASVIAELLLVRVVATLCVLAQVR
jgi:hypothetical protein